MRIINFRTPGIALFFLMSILSPGQDLWRKGTITLRTGEVQEGFIHDLEWKEGPTEIEFKQEGQQPIRYGTSHILEFSTDRPAKYRSLTVQYDNDPQSPGRLPLTREPGSLKQTTAFLEVLVDAGISLVQLHVRGADRKHFFIVRDSTVTLLLNRRYNRDGTNQSMFTYDKYKQPLALLSLGCPELEKQVKSLRYNEEALSRFIRSLNECKGLTMSPYQQETKPTAWGVSAFTFFNSSSFTYATTEGGAFNFGIGGFAESFSRRKPNQRSFYNEIDYRYVNQPAVLVGTLEDATIRFHQIIIFSIWRHSYSKGPVARFFWDIGVANGVRFGTKLDGLPTHEIGDSQSEFQIGLVVALGRTFPINSQLELSTVLRWDNEIAPFYYSQFLGAANLGLCFQVRIK